MLHPQQWEFLELRWPWVVLQWFTSAGVQVCLHQEEKSFYYSLSSFFLDLLLYLIWLCLYIFYTVILLLFWWYQQNGSWQEEITNCRSAITSAFKMSFVVQVLRDHLHPGFSHMSVEKLYVFSPPPCQVSQIINSLSGVTGTTRIAERGEEEAQGALTALYNKLKWGCGEVGTSLISQAEV